MGAVTLRTQPLNRKLDVTRPTQLCARRRQMGKEPLALTSFILAVTLVTSSHTSVQDPAQVS